MDLLWYSNNIHAVSGYSEEGRHFLEGLVKRGVSVGLVDRSGKRGTWSGYFTLNDGVTPIVYHTYRHGEYQRKAGQWSIARTMLEVSKIPQSWIFRFGQMDEIWVPNLFNRDIFLKSGVTLNKLKVIKSPIAETLEIENKPFPLKTRKTFRFLSVFDYSARKRKGLDLLLAAYCSRFSRSDDVCLVIKSQTTLTQLEQEYGLDAGHPEIEIVDSVLSPGRLNSLYRDCQAFVLPTRGEGIGRPLLDALRLGLTVIATGWGGQTDFLTPENAHLIRYTLSWVGPDTYLNVPGYYGAQWAEPDVKHLRQLLGGVIKVRRRIELNRAGSEKLPGSLNCFSQDRITDSVLHAMTGCGKYTAGLFEHFSIFQHLFPVYYPDLGSPEEVADRNRQDFKREMGPVLLLGNGYTFLRAGRELAKRDLTFEAIEYPFTLPESNIKSLLRAGIDSVILAGNRRRIGEFYSQVSGICSDIPVYVFY